MKFKFNFEVVLKERKIRRDEAQREYRQALSKAEDQKRKISKLKSDLSNARLEVQTVKENGGKLASALVSISEFIEGQKIIISLQAKALKGLEEIAELKRQILVESQKEVKSLEKLKEKRYTEFKIQLRKHEMKQIDEMSVMRAARGKIA